MYLSKIEIIGFKSFAQRINVNFDTGVTAIVGPNGCGKTNIVDAIRWALGEQRYSTLRSDKMEDVIFNGTKSRKPLGLAEVSLSIENTKGILPTEYSEVTITRRVFRSGESEYLLNKVPCRLKDILDLFMDTGMGSDAYSVIELKMIETILSDKTDERRKLFEEAAGVTKYKHRRKAAMRKLESVQLDLSRVNDIVKEVQKTVSSLERQAKKAEQYNEVSSRLKALEIDLQEREYAYLHAKLKPIEERFSLARTDKSAIDESLRAQEEQIDQLRTGLAEIESELRAAQQSVTAELGAVHRVEEKVLVASERLSALGANIGRYEEEKTDLQGQQETIAGEKVAHASRRAQLQEEYELSARLFATMKEEYEQLGRLVDTKKANVQSLKDAILALAHELIQKRGEQERIKARMDNLTGRIDRAQEDANLYQSDIRTNESLVADLTAKDKELRRQFVEAEMHLYEKEKDKKELKTEVDRLQKSVLEIRNDIERKLSKIDFIRKMLESNEGYSDGAKHLLGHAAWKQKKIVTIADSVRAQEKYRVAIEAALGETAHYLVVDTVQDGYAAVAELKTSDKGKASIVSLEWIPRVKRAGRKKLNIPYVWASDVIDCDDRLRPLMNFLLDDVILVETLGVAEEVFRKVTGVRCITLDGHIVGSTGLFRGGSRRLDEGGSIGKTALIEDLQKEVAARERELQAAEADLAGTSARYDQMEMKGLSDRVKAIEKEMTAIEMRIAQLEFEKKRANDGVDRNATEISVLKAEIVQLQAQHEAMGGEVAALERRRQEQESVAQSAIREFESLELEWNEQTKAVNEEEIKVVTLHGDLRNIDRDIERAAARIDDIRVTLIRRDAEIARATEESIRLTAEIDAHHRELETLRAGLGVLEERKKGVEESYAARRNDLHQRELKIKDERRAHDDSIAAAHDLEMKIAEIRASIEHVKLRAKEEFELDLELKTYPEDEFVDFAHLREEVKNLKDRIRILGAINFAAFDEFTTESERLTFLSQQRDDLIDAEKTLLSTIEEINATAQRIFSETFAKIRENFIAIFKELFLEGDECDLKLEEGVDPLEAKIEIIAKPRGKRPTSIDLLSGGEKTLTAIALLFAIYLVKPSPFCILDEVDAPLDDSNIDRYTRILKKFSSNTQFIVVTHNKRTMEAASAMYGITMEEEGVSKIVTVRFNDEARLRSATVTN
jgi:chromosome segregation protein